MKDDSKSIPKKNSSIPKKSSFEIPSHVIRTGKILQFFSTTLATNFALKIFRTPPKFKIPEREDQIAAGPVFSYHEFKQPMKDRLTDEAWQSMLKQRKAPSLSKWTKTFRAVGSAQIN